MSEVHVLGCGPAGLLAAHAVRLAGHDPVIHSIKEPSIIKGAQFIHEPIEGMTGVDPDFIITFEKWGYPEEYAMKVYGSPDAPTSWNDFPEGEVPAWGMVQTYQKLWDTYEDLIIDTEIRAPYIKDLLESGAHVISSITPMGYCGRLEDPSPHLFEWQDVWIESVHSLTTPRDGLIVYNGNPNDRWYRSSLIQGHGSTEYGQAMPRVKRSRKPLRTNCNCFERWPNFHRVGRFGEFKKGLLVHDAFTKARKISNAL